MIFFWFHQPPAAEAIYRRRHQMGTFSASLAICAGNSPVPGQFPTQRPVTRSFDVFLDLRLNKRLSKQPWGWWFESLSGPLWRHRNVAALHRWKCLGKIEGWYVSSIHITVQLQTTWPWRIWLKSTGIKLQWNTKHRVPFAQFMG